MNTHANQRDPVAEEIAALRRAVAIMAEQIRLLRVPISPVLTLDDAAKVIGTSGRTVRRLVDRGLLPSVRLPSARGHGTVLRVQASDVQAFIDQRRAAAPPTRAGSGRQTNAVRKTVRVPPINL